MRILNFALLLAFAAVGFAVPVDVEGSGEEVISDSPRPCEAVTEAPTQPPCQEVTEAPSTLPPCATEAPATEPPCAADATTAAPCRAATTQSPCKARRPAKSAGDDDEEFDAVIDDSKNATCKTWSKCYSNNDCAGGKGGTCVGAFIGTCHCLSCVHFYPCTDDSHCGGFNGACDLQKNQCDCFGAYEKNGLENIGKAALNFCNIKKCSPDADDCFGLPCQSGKCICNL